jgi:hypothetical protein
MAQIALKFTIGYNVLLAFSTGMALCPQTTLA